MDILKSNLGVCQSVVARINAWQGWPDGRGTDTYAIPRQHAGPSHPDMYWISIKEVYGPNGKVTVSDIIAQLEASEVASMMTYDELVAEGGIPTDTI